MRKKEPGDIPCSQCGKTPDTIVEWQGKWYCQSCDAERRRQDILAQGTIIDEDGLPCNGCLFGIREVDMHVIDPDGDGPYHKECAIANCEEGQSVRLAPDKIVSISREQFEKFGSRIRKQ